MGGGPASRLHAMEGILFIVERHPAIPRPFAPKEWNTPSQVRLPFNGGPFYALPQTPDMCQEETTALHHQADLACSSTETGSLKENVEPCPTTDSTQIFPPCISMIRFEIASPSPVPPFLRVIELSAC
jgi:hypothetical protein